MDLNHARLPIPPLRQRLEGMRPKRKRELYSDTIGLSTLQWRLKPVKETHFRVQTQTASSGRDRDPYQAREAKKYANPIPSREFILNLMEEHGAPLRFEDLAEALELVDPEQLDALSRRLNAMARDGQVVLQPARWLLRRQPRGPDPRAGHRSPRRLRFPAAPTRAAMTCSCSPREMRRLWHGDRIVARVTGLDRRGRREAAVVEVLERAVREPGRTDPDRVRCRPSCRRTTSARPADPDRSGTPERRHGRSDGGGRDHRAPGDSGGSRSARSPRSSAIIWRRAWRPTSPSAPTISRWTGRKRSSRRSHALKRRGAGEGQAGPGRSARDAAGDHRRRGRARLRRCGVLRAHQEGLAPDGRDRRCLGLCDAGYARWTTRPTSAAPRCISRIA